MSQSQYPSKNPKTCRPGKPGQTPRLMKLTVSEGLVAFRLLCSIHAAAGVIGHSGIIVKRLETETSARIHVEDAVCADSLERLIHVIGSRWVDRNFRVGEDVVDVSAAQLALLRVFERELEVSEVGGGTATVRCRLLLAPGMVGAVIGEAGKGVNNVVKETGAHIKIFPPGSLPPCAAVSDELLQITGGSLAVKKALVIISRCLQERESQLAGASSSVSHPTMTMITNNAGINDKADGGVAKEVVFRILCPCDTAGAVIGWKGRKVRALENETGASICFSAPESRRYERVITVSAFESKESHCSVAQNAVLRIFNEVMSSGGKGTVTARLLIQPNQARWLNAGESSIISAIRKATDAKLHILEGNWVPGVTANERIIQIDGDYSKVSDALFQVSWRLRESYFDTLLAPLLPHKLFNPCPSPNAAMLADKMKDCRVSEDGSSMRKFPCSQFSNGHYSTSIGSPTDLAAADGGFELGSENKSFTVTTTKVEILIHEDVFGSVYGVDGSNLARLRRISGATVDVQGPCPGVEWKVAISGTPDQVRTAQSLLQAFMMPAV